MRRACAVLTVLCPAHLPQHHTRSVHNVAQPVEEPLRRAAIGVDDWFADAVDIEITQRCFPSGIPVFNLVSDAIHVEICNGVTLLGNPQRRKSFKVDVNESIAGPFDDEVPSVEKPQNGHGPAFVYPITHSGIRDRHKKCSNSIDYSFQAAQDRKQNDAKHVDNGNDEPHIYEPFSNNTSIIDLLHVTSVPINVSQSFHQ